MTKLCESDLGAKILTTTRLVIISDSLTEDLCIQVREENVSTFIIDQKIFAIIIINALH